MRWGVKQGGEQAAEPQDQPPKGDLLGGAFSEACGRSSGPPKGCGRSSGPSMSFPGGFLLGAEGDIDCLFLIPVMVLDCS